MAGKNKKKKPSGNIVAQNRRARHDYYLTEHVEAGLQLYGSEVKSLRAGQASLVDSFASDEGGELYLMNAHIPGYANAGKFDHEPRRKRKLLLHRREIGRLMGAVQRKGMTLVPVSIYFNARGLAKVDLAIGEGKRTVDKRDTIKDRDWGRQKARLMREKS